MTKSYLTVASQAYYCYEEKKSQFIAQIWPIREKSEGTGLLAEARLEWPDARHYCSAYIIGNPQQTCSAGFNDDGEPSGTAGKPMLNVLMQRDVGDVFAVVTRYFGGIKLGAGGLARAYGQAVSGALDEATFRQIVPQTLLRVEIGYPLEAAVRLLLEQHKISEPVVQYGQGVILLCHAPSDRVEDLRTAIVNRCSGAAKVQLISQEAPQPGKHHLTN